MKSDWILDVLSDLKAYAQSNDMPEFARHLDVAKVTVLTEISRKLEQGAPSETAAKLRSG